MVEREDHETHAIVRTLRLARWGLVSSWATDPVVGARMVSAHVETVHEKRSFSRAFAQRRATVPADAFDEWAHLAAEATAVLRAPAPALVETRVPTDANRVANDGPQLLAPLPD